MVTRQATTPFAVRIAAGVATAVLLVAAQAVPVAATAACTNPDERRVVTERGFESSFDSPVLPQPHGSDLTIRGNIVNVGSVVEFPILVHVPPEPAAPGPAGAGVDVPAQISCPGAGDLRRNA